ncbi:hypothetical protein HD597_000903 [Nonomuraea thailandensis]|uniref:Uncharacterized protein n=1 Tax=Nonomuraea thailandensis TaxID=1188745 RepID=A0A9X2GFU7_9ACTN|nr:hypothetical protein [Nonomuraea thailandensis]MCP2353883.1 hypothetical protein [Nonomuraea thailandensis]
MLSYILTIFNLIVSLVVLLGGVALMAMRRKEHGRASVVGMVGCIMLLLGGVIGGVFSLMLPNLVESLGMRGFTPVSLIVNVAVMLLQAVGTALLVWAVIMPRNQPQPTAQGAWQPQPEWQPGQPDWQGGSQPGQPGWQPGPQPGQPGPQPGQPGWHPGPQQQPPGWQTPPQPPFGQGQG